MGNWYQMSAEQVLREVKSSEQGISDEEAANRLLENGSNELKEEKRKSFFRVFLEQFLDMLVWILMGAAIISAISGNMESTLVILTVLVLNAILGTVQHEKAQKSLESLKSLSSPRAKVRRNGRKIEIDSREVVAGDILELEAGDLVPADGRILNNYSLQVNESSLTGESTNIDKEEKEFSGEAALGDRVNMVYSGSLVTYGRASVVVTETGMNTEMGKIAALMNATKEKKTPLQKSLDAFSKKLAFIILAICVLIFVLSLYRHMGILDSLLFAVALAVAAIPEALGSIVTIVQAMGTQKMAKENAIIKDLKAVESLGCVSVICSDKTGTLTQNRMTVQQAYVGEQVISPEQFKLSNQLHRYLLYCAVLSNDSQLDEDKEIGDPTEIALLAMAHKQNVDSTILREVMDRIEEIPFDSDRKLMSTKYALHGINTILTKGAVDVLLERAVSIWSKDGVREMTDEDRRNILDKNLMFSERGLRVLAFAYRESDEELTLDAEKNYTFLGLISMMDPPREESCKAVVDAEGAGIRTVMITGDHKVTASAIAAKLNILKQGQEAVLGVELDAMSEEELLKRVENISVYARVSPENKIRIVNAWQQKGAVVAMTGDGVNDAPALKKADIGVAMGITGTEVSKDAAAMILTDDNFATIIKAVANGRNVYRNIKNAIGFLLSGNMAGILSVLYTSLLALPIPFQPVQLLFINLLTDSLPALAIGVEPAEHNLLKEPPRNVKEGILNRNFMGRILLQGLMIAIVSLIAFYMGLSEGPVAASTMAFITLTLARLFHGFNCRSNSSLLEIGFRRNLYSVAAFVLGCVLLALVIFIPLLRKLFMVAPLSLTEVLILVLLAVIPTILIQAVRIVKYRIFN